MFFHSLEYYNNFQSQLVIRLFLHLCLIKLFFNLFGKLLRYVSEPNCILKILYGFIVTMLTIQYIVCTLSIVIWGEQNEAHSPPAIFD